VTSITRTPIRTCHKAPMSGYEKSPDYGGRGPGPRGTALLIAIVALVVVGGALVLP